MASKPVCLHRALLLKGPCPWFKALLSPSSNSQVLNEGLHLHSVLGPTCSAACLAKTIWGSMLVSQNTFWDAVLSMYSGSSWVLRQSSSSSTASSLAIRVHWYKWRERWRHLSRTLQTENRGPWREGPWLSSSWNHIHKESKPGQTAMGSGLRVINIAADR